MTEKLGKKERLSIGRQIVVFIGPEGSGKTTQALLLAEATGMPYISTGDTLRHLAKYDFETIYGEACRVMFQKDGYLDGQLLLEILVKRFGEEDTCEGFILDGGLRTLGETQDFQAMLDAAGRALPLSVVHLQIPNETSLERLVSGERARKRKGDTREGVTERLANFHLQFEERMAVIDSQPNWNRIEVDASGLIEEVYGKVCEVLTG
jgi:adenylate kinase